MVVALQQSFGTGGSPSTAVNASSVTVSLTGSWEPFAATIAVPSIAGKTIGTNGDDHLKLDLWISSGYTGSQTNGLGLQTIAVDFWGIHILQGTHGVEACDNYIAPRVVDELPRCKRYYNKLITGMRNHATAASQPTTTTMAFPEMRAIPSTTLTGGNTYNGTFAVYSFGSLNSIALISTSTSIGSVASIEQDITLDAEL